MKELWGSTGKGPLEPRSEYVRALNLHRWHMQSVTLQASVSTSLLLRMQFFSNSESQLHM